MIMPILGQFAHEGVVTVLLGIAGSLLMSPIRKIKRAYAELREAIQSTHTELLHQRTNCLHNLQNQGDAQVKLLEKTVEVLGEIRIGQAEMSGYLKSQNEHRHSD